MDHKMNMTSVTRGVSRFLCLILESQQATQSKKAALLQLKAWMDKFDATAKIALYDKPQLLEVLGIFVRS